MELQSWKKEILSLFEWYAGMLELIEETRERGYHTYINDVQISIESFKLKLERMQNLPNPKLKECNKVKNLLEESIKLQIKMLQLEAKYFMDIQNRTMAGRLGAGAVSQAAVRSMENLKKSQTEYKKNFGDF